MVDSACKQFAETTYTPPGDENFVIIVEHSAVIRETTYAPSGDENALKHMFSSMESWKQLTPRQGTKTRITRFEKAIGGMK